METGYLFLGIGILSMAFAYGLFTGAQYFSVGYMLLLLALPLVSAALLALSYLIHGRERQRKQKGDAMVGLGILLSGISIMIIAIETNFVFFSSPDTWTNTLRTSVFIVAIAFSATFVAYLVSVSSTRKKGTAFALLLVVLMITSSIAIARVEFVAALGPSAPVGTDELAIDYYAAATFLAGHNPYTANFNQDLANSDISPTLNLNGTRQYTYTYPALNFLLLTPFAALIGSYSNFLWVALTMGTAILIMCLVLLFRAGNDNTQLLIPAFAISLAMFSLTPWALPKLIVMLLLLLAYIFRQKAYAYPILLGMAVSVHEIAWIAFPFFLILTLKENGRKRALLVFAISAAVFLVINAYFLYSSTAAFVNNLLGSGLPWLLPRGLDLMQFLIVFYPVEYGYLFPFFLLLYAVMLLLFYLSKGARPLICLATSVLFMFSTSSSFSYILPFMPLLVYLLIERKHEEKANAKSRRKIAYSACVLAALLVLFLTMTLYSHVAYVKLDAINMVQAVPVITNSSQGVSNLQRIVLRIRTSLQNQTTMNFYLVSIRPATTRETLVYLTHTNASVQYGNYTIYAGLYNISNYTKVRIFASSDHYITST